VRLKGIFVAPLLLVSCPAFALSTRVFVKSTGMDIGTCPITSPCRSFAYAMTQVAASGEVIALDTAGYGPFDVTQSVTVFAAPGATAFIAAATGAAIYISSAGPTDVIVLRGLALSGVGAAYGIEFFSGHSLAIENCIINGFGGSGVDMTRSSDSTNPGMRIEHSTIRNNALGVGIYNFGAGSPPVGMTISNCTFLRNSFRAIDGGNNSRVVVTDTVVAANGDGIGADANADNSVAEVDVERCTITGNQIDAVFAGANVGQTLRGILRLAHNVITGNVKGVSEYPDGVVMTMTSGGTTTNTIEGNVTNGTFSGSYAAK